MWKAKFSNGDVLNGIDENNKEVLFRKVLDRLDELENLSIVLENKIFTVRMADGRFSTMIDDKENHFFALDAAAMDLKCIRPIYFVNETADFTTTGQSLTALGPPRVNFTALGFQTNLNGRNVKRYLTIFPDGTFVIKDK